MRLLFLFCLIGFLDYVPTDNVTNTENFTQTLAGTDVTFDMIYVAFGDDFKGSDVSENKAHKQDYYISEYEVTWDMYKLFLERTVDRAVAENIDDQVEMEVDAVTGATVPYVDMSLGMGTDAGLPVCNVTVLSASRFCQWLSAKTGKFYRLPTEEEWENAALAGSSTKFFFGEDTADLDDYAWYKNNSDDSYHHVGMKKPNLLGLYDVYGNVAEWALRPTRKMGSGITTFIPVLKGGAYHMSGEEIDTKSYLEPSKRWKERDPQFPRSKWWYTDAGFVGFRIVNPVHTPPKSELNLYWNIEN